MSELEAQVGAPEPVDGDGQLDNFPPARAVTVVEDEGVVGAPVRLPGTQADAVLEERSTVRCRVPAGRPRMSLSLGHVTFSLARLLFSHQATSVRRENSLGFKFNTFGNHRVDGTRSRQSWLLCSLGQRARVLLRVHPGH